MGAEDFLVNAVRCIKSGITTRRDAIDHYRLQYSVPLIDAIFDIDRTIGDYNEGLWR